VQIKATLTDVQRQTKRIFRHVAGGNSVPVTDYGEVVATIKPAAVRRVVSLDEFLAADISDAAIVEAVQEANR
jgi:antitoxin (DNA-binding transcriptional repressor) of toxin-antitoxin stability system